jgi:hypothetical protein
MKEILYCRNPFPSERNLLLLEQILKENSTSSGALLGRGTAYAFMRNLKKAVSDFSKVTLSYCNED